MLDLSRRDSGLPVTPDRMAVIRADEGPEIAAEIGALTEHLGLSDDPDHGSA